MSNDSRIPAGIPTGGQFAAQTRTEAGTNLPADPIDPAVCATVDRAAESVDESELDALARHQSPDVRNAVAQNPDTSVDTLQLLAEDADESVRDSAVWSLNS